MKRISILTCLFFVISAGSFTAAKAQVNTADSLALVDLYNSTNGPHWYNFSNHWLTTEPVSTWYGVTVTGNRVTQIILSYNNLSGTIPATIGNLTSLQYLDLGSNNISGTIPAEIYNIVSFQTLSLDGNHLTGAIAPAVGNLTNIQNLDFGYNQLTGAIPAEIGNLNNLYYLYLSYNQLTGAIPPQIGNLANLAYLFLSENQLSGAIPPEIGNLAKLYKLVLFNNQLSGAIPAEIGNLSNLAYIFLNENRLSGAIPAEVGKLTKLIYLFLYNNQLSGAIPPEIGNITNLENLDLSQNNLSGAIPAEMGNLSNLSYFAVSFNHITGEVPASFKQLNQLGFIYLDHNLLSKDSNISFSVNKKNYINGDISYNLFNFNGVQLVSKKYPRIVYAPQKTILPIHQNGNTLSVSAGGTLRHNTYRWHQAGVAEFATINADSTFTPSQSGMYYVIASNNVANKLKLHSDTINFVLPAARQSNTSIAAKTIIPATAVKNMLVYPNPASNLIHIQTNGVAIITLTNSDGKVLLSKNINNTAEINISAFANGIYFVQNKTSGEVEKIVVVH